MSIGHAESFRIRAEAIARIGPSLQFTVIGDPDQPDAIELPHPFVGYSDRQQYLLRFLADLDLSLSKYIDPDRSSFPREVTAELLTATEKLVRFYREYGELYGKQPQG
jgi:hypothetical protein